MKIKARRPKSQPLRTLINTTSLGKVKIQPNTDTVQCEILTAAGETITFEKE